MGFPGSSDGKEPAYNVGDSSSIPGPGEGNGNPLQYSCLENSMDRGAWWATVHGSQRVGNAIQPSISSSVVPFSSCPQSFPASGPFLMSQPFTSGGQRIGASASSSVLLMNIQR